MTSNSGAGPDIIIGFSDAPHIYVDKLIELTEVADYLGKRYGGWQPLAQKYGMRHKSNAWIGLPFGATAGPLIYRKSILKSVGFDTVPEDHAGFLDLCRKLQKAGKPAGFALGNAKGDGNGFANWVLWSHNASLLDEEGNITINSKETVAALKYLKELYPTFIAGTPSWNDVSNNRAYSSGEISLTANGVSLYFSLKNDPATAAIAEDTEHQLLPKGVAKNSPMAGLTLNAMVFKHSPYPNAAKAFLQFMLERDQYEPWLNANSGYWSQPLAAYADAAVWSSDPKVKIFKEHHGQSLLRWLQGPDLDSDRCCHRRLRAGADVRGGCDRRCDAGGRRRRSGAPHQALLPQVKQPASQGPSLRAKRSNPPPRRKNWIASSLTLLAMTATTSNLGHEDEHLMSVTTLPSRRVRQREPGWPARLFDYKPFLIVICLTPAIDLLLVFLTYPLGLGVWLAFTDTTIGRRGVFVGLGISST